APLIAWISTRGRTGERVALGWNVVGLLALLNAVALVALTTPALNLIHSEVPDVAIGAFPFTYIAGFFAPLAMALHALSIRSLRARLRSTRHLRAPATASRSPYQTQLNQINQTLPGRKAMKSLLFPIMA